MTNGRAVLSEKLLGEQRSSEAPRYALAVFIERSAVSDFGIALREIMESPSDVLACAGMIALDLVGWGRFVTDGFLDVTEALIEAVRRNGSVRAAAALHVLDILSDVADERQRKRLLKLD